MFKKYFNKSFSVEGRQQFPYQKMQLHKNVRQSVLGWRGMEQADVIGSG
jgi:hypothetical protein